MQFAEAGVDVLQFAGCVAAVSPQARDDEDQAEDEQALAAECEAEGEVPIYDGIGGE